MPILYLTLATLLGAASVFGKMYTRRVGDLRDSTNIYTFLLLICACLGWGALYLSDFSFAPGVLIYSLLFSLCYMAAHLGIIEGMKCGSATLTTLFINLSLILVTIWGFLFWSAEVTVPVVIGLILVCIAIYLCLYTGKKEEYKISLKWILYMVLGCAGNAGCAIVQRSEQRAFDGAHGNMLMFFALVFSVLLFSIIFLRSNKRDLKAILKKAWWGPVLAGTLNVGHNLFVILLATTALSTSLIYPVIGVGGLAVVTIFSLFVFKEKMYWWQWVGVGIGAVAVVLLSI